MPREKTFGDYLWGVGDLLRGRNVMVSWCQIIALLVETQMPVWSVIFSPIPFHNFWTSILCLLFIFRMTTSIHVYIHIRIKDSTNILLDFSATCMLERKSLQQFKEEWLVKFPITYKVKASNTWSSSNLIDGAVQHMISLKYLLFSWLFK